MSWGSLTGQYMTGFLIAVLLWAGLKRLKQGRGSLWLLNACYWYLPAVFFRPLYRVIPESAYRFWLR